MYNYSRFTGTLFDLISILHFTEEENLNTILSKIGDIYLMWPHRNINCLIGSIKFQFTRWDYIDGPRLTFLVWTDGVMLESHFGFWVCDTSFRPSHRCAECGPVEPLSIIRRAHLVSPTILQRFTTYISSTFVSANQPLSVLLPFSCHLCILLRSCWQFLSYFKHL